MNLPEHEPDPNLWDRVEARIQADATLNRAIEQLPEHEPDANLWERVEADLSDAKVVPIGRGATRSLGTVSWLAGAVAAMLVLAGGWLYLNQTSADERVTVAYSVEQVKTQATDLPQPQTESVRRDEAFIVRHCAEQKPVCQKPEVHELRSQLVELKQEQARLGKEIALFGADPALVRAQTKLESQRAEITRELVTLLQS